MINITECKECGGEEKQYLCDTCGVDLLFENLGLPVTISFGYGSELDGEEYHFCNLNCLKKFINDEISKDKPKDNRFIFGEK